MKKTDVVQLRVRIRGALLSMIRAEAKRNKIAPNEEIIRRVEASFMVDERIADLRERLEARKQAAAEARGQLRKEHVAIMAELRTLNEWLLRQSGEGLEHVS